jgi:hypothetical protein
MNRRAVTRWTYTEFHPILLVQDAPMKHLHALLHRLHADTKARQLTLPTAPAGNPPVRA